MIVGVAVGFVGAYLAMPVIRPDFVNELQTRLDSLGMEMDSTTVATTEPDAAEQEPDGDSLTTLRTELESMKAEALALAEHNEELAMRLDSLIGKKEAVAQLATTLGAVEDKELGPLVQSLSDELLVAVYTSSNRKNQARILSNIPAEQAARLIQGLFESNKN